MRQKTVTAGELGMFFLELGRIPTVQEYRSFSNVPLRWAGLKRFYGNWNRMLRFMAQMQPDIWAEIQNLGSETSNEDEEILRKMEEALKSEPAEDAVED